jgi:putative copper export protein
MRTLYLLNVTVHVLAAMLWVGGMLFLGLVGAPVLRRVEPAALRARLFRDLGRAFRPVGWGAIGVLLATGVTNLWLTGVLDGRLATASFWSAPYGRTLAWKLAAVAAMLATSALHDFVLGPRAGRLDPASSAAVRARSRAAWLARIGVVLGLAVVVAAVRLARGG